MKSFTVVLNHWTKIKMSKLANGQYLMQVYTFDNQLVSQIRCNRIQDGVKLARVLQRPLGKAA